MTAQFKFMGYREDEILFDVQPVIHDEIEFEISVRPKNGMTAIYDLVETPTISLPVNPVEDAYITTDTPYNSINNGDARSMLIGRDIKGEHRGLIKFDLSSIDNSLYVKSAKLRIYYSNLNPNATLNLYTVIGKWDEYSVTYLNKPDIKDFITSEYVINEEESYIEFNVSPIVTNWIKGIPNDGFYLLSSDFSSTFRTRESFFSPILFVDYKDFSHKASYSKSEFEVRVKALDDSDIEFVVDVGETYTTDDIEFEVFAHDPSHTYTEDVEWELTSVEIIPTQKSEDIEWEVVSTKSDLNQIHWEFTVNTLIYVYEYNDIEWELSVNKEVYIQDYDETEWEINVNSSIVYIDSENEVEFDIEVSTYTEDSDVEFEIDIFEHTSDDIEWEIYIPHSDIEWEVTPLFNDENEIEFEVNPRTYYISDIEFELTVPIYLDDTEVEWDAFIRAVGDSKVEFEIEVNMTKGYAYAFII